MFQSPRLGFAPLVIRLLAVSVPWHATLVAASVNVPYPPPPHMPTVPTAVAWLHSKNKKLDIEVPETRIVFQPVSAPAKAWIRQVLPTTQPTPSTPTLFRLKLAASMFDVHGVCEAAPPD